MNTCLIKNARVIDPSQGLDKLADILLNDGRIAQIGAVSTPADRTINAAGLVAAPGLVDMHVHLRDPGFTEKEDIYSGCRAAAAGGVTSLLAMPNTKPVTDNPAVLKAILEKAQSADARVYVAAAITVSQKSEELCDLPALQQAGAAAFSDDGRPVTDTLLMAKALQQAHQLKIPVVSHCEDLFLARGGIMNEGAVSRELDVPGIPAAAEDCGTAREIALAAAYNVPVHICHVSTRTSVALIRDAKRRGVPVTAETAPHYFMLTDTVLCKKDADYRMNPPLRTEEDRLAIIEGLRDGTLDAIATDHAPHTPQEKSDFLKAPNGSVGMETSLAAGLTELVHKGFLTLPQLIHKMSSAPAAILGISAGTLSIGEPADLVLFDPNEPWTVDPEKLHGKSRNTPFKGMQMRGRVSMTLCRGKIVYEHMVGKEE